MKTKGEILLEIEVLSKLIKELKVKIKALKKEID
nr:MAG TPA: protein of unknown function (DUF5320) [Caudoviricetes sp.]